MQGRPASRYMIPASAARCELVIERSRFIASLAPAAGVEEARSFIASVAAEFADATHNCWAYLIGPPGSTSQIGLSDDGEPHGTAGRPLLNMLLHSGLGDVCVVVTRYYGGIKLGTGGLSRAYSAAVQEVLAIVERGEKISWRRLSVTADYAQLESLRRILPAHEAELLSEVFTDKVLLLLRVPAESMQALKDALTDRSHGQAKLAELPEEM